MLAFHFLVCWILVFDISVYGFLVFWHLVCDIWMSCISVFDVFVFAILIFAILIFAILVFGTLTFDISVCGGVDRLVCVSEIMALRIFVFVIFVFCCVWD